MFQVEATAVFHLSLALPHFPALCAGGPDKDNSHPSASQSSCKGLPIGQQGRKKEYLFSFLLLSYSLSRICDAWSQHLVLDLWFYQAFWNLPLDMHKNLSRRGRLPLLWGLSLNSVILWASEHWFFQSLPGRLAGSALMYGYLGDPFWPISLPTSGTTIPSGKLHIRMSSVCLVALNWTLIHIS